MSVCQVGVERWEREEVKPWWMVAAAERLLFPPMLGAGGYCTVWQCDKQVGGR